MSTARDILGAGLVSLDLWNEATQSFYGFDDPIDADQFEIVPDSETKTSTSRSHNDYGQARASVVVTKPTKINIKLAASSVRAFAMQFQGMVQSLSQSSGTWSGQTMTVTKRGVWLSLNKRNVAAEGFSVTSADGEDTYTLNTHYKVNWARGEIMFLEVAGAPAVEDTVKFSGTYNAVDGKEILGGRVTQVRCRARFDGMNMVNRERMEVDVHECVLGTGSGYDFLAADFNPIQLQGEIVTPAGYTEGYVVRFPQRSGN